MKYKLTENKRFSLARVILGFITKICPPLCSLNTATRFICNLIMSKCGILLRHLCIYHVKRPLVKSQYKVIFSKRGTFALIRLHITWLGHYHLLALGMKGDPG